MDIFENRQTPCRICGQPVGMLSYGGPDVCAWCDSGVNRDGTKWTYMDYVRLQGKPPDTLPARPVADPHAALPGEGR